MQRDVRGRQKRGIYCRQERERETEKKGDTEGREREIYRKEQRETENVREEDKKRERRKNSDREVDRKRGRYSGQRKMIELEEEAGA